MFGGIAGIVSISRHEQTNAIPGVAIATALMPPLCTAGFGLATANWNYFFGAFYLFFINAVFISLSTYLIVRYLHFPEKEFINKKVARQYRIWFIVLSIVALTPSVYFLYTVYRDQTIKEDINELVLSPIETQGNEILKWELENKDTSKLIKVYHSGRKLNDSLKKSIDSTLITHKMGSYHLVSIRVNLTKEEVSELSAEMTKQMFQEMHLDEIKQSDTVAVNAGDTLSYTQVNKEVKIAFPFVDSISNGWQILPNNKSSLDTFPVIYYETVKPVNKRQTNLLYKYLLTRLGTDTVVLLKK